MKANYLFLVLVFMSVLAVPASAGGKEVELAMVDGTVITGELLAVREHTILVGMDGWSAPRTAGDVTDGVVSIKRDSIQVAHIEGHSYVAIGLFGGLAAGAVIGSLAGKSTGDKETFAGELGSALGAGVWGAIGGLAGLAVGGLAGAAASSSDRDFTSKSPGEFNLLKQFARYPIEEPEFLTVIP